MPRLFTDRVVLPVKLHKQQQLAGIFRSTTSYCYSKPSLQNGDCNYSR